MIKLNIKRCALILGLCLYLYSAFVSAAPELLDRIIVIVNDDVITETELAVQVNNISKQLLQQNRPLPSDQILQRQVLERMILTRLQLQLANSGGIRVDDDTLDRAMESIAEQNKLSLRGFRDTLEVEGYNYVSFREEIRNEIIISRLRQREIDRRILVTEQEVQNMLATQATQGSQNDEYHLSHILISILEGTTPDKIAAAREQAQDVLARLKAGENFSEIAVKESDGQNALQGGDLGWRKAGQLPTLFADEVISMQGGDISDLIRSPSGFHIMRLNEKRSLANERHIVKQTMARHILIKPDELSTAEDVTLRLQRVIERIAQGEDFAELARSISQDRASAVEGGSLGWVNSGDMVPEFEEEMNKLKDGEISAPFKSRFGWHIVQVQERREVDDTEKFQRDRARELIRKRKTEEEYQIWLHRLRTEAYIDYRHEV
jgi:peptidyl-prolyl cis-trans isomerase SurA